ncbi:hypothetical protein BDP27DRAFT_1326677 [Rhodocollybia butyracea]|uniref:Uncharacterized protein n=1 Tax=Rhodocollybia butyracea TaxID=206335 RepID=A0A9P5PMZ5_9AGAR|nr:hypothetical protein BDP27DRAFT_1326677 [Rhodocollybia butyracea]
MCISDPTTQSRSTKWWRANNPMEQMYAPRRAALSNNMGSVSLQLRRINGSVHVKKSEKKRTRADHIPTYDSIDKPESDPWLSFQYNSLCNSNNTPSSNDIQSNGKGNLASTTSQPPTGTTRLLRSSASKASKPTLELSKSPERKRRRISPVTTNQSGDGSCSPKYQIITDSPSPQSNANRALIPSASSIEGRPNPRLGSTPSGLPHPSGSSIPPLGNCIPVQHHSVGSASERVSLQNHTATSHSKVEHQSSSSVAFQNNTGPQATTTTSTGFFQTSTSSPTASGSESSTVRESEAEIDRKLEEIKEKKRKLYAELAAQEIERDQIKKKRMEAEEAELEEIQKRVEQGREGLNALKEGRL